MDRFDRERLSLQLCLGTDEVVEPIALLRRVETDVSSHGKLYPLIERKLERQEARADQLLEMSNSR